MVKTLVAVCAVRFFHLVVFYTCRLEQGVVCVCVCEDEVSRRTKTDSGRVWWSGSRLAAPEEFISTRCSANRECLSPAAHSRGEEEDVTLLWSRVSGCCIEKFKVNLQLSYCPPSIIMLTFWWMTYQLAFYKQHLERKKIIKSYSLS